MVKNRVLKSVIVSFCLLFLACGISFSQDFNHIKELFDIRTSISNQGSMLPDAITIVSGKDVRTLERIFELNTSALTTIEAYFRIFKMALAPEVKIDDETIKIVNEWLVFIKNQCAYDVEYLEAALTETENETVMEHIIMSKENIEQLSNAAKKGLQENKEMMGSL